MKVEQVQEQHIILVAIDVLAGLDPAEKLGIFEELQKKVNRSGFFLDTVCLDDGQFVLGTEYFGPRYGDDRRKNREAEIIQGLRQHIPYDVHMLPVDDLLIDESIGHADLHFNTNPHLENNPHAIVKHFGKGYSRPEGLLTPLPSIN